MILKHFDISTPRMEAPEDEGWLQAWHGKYEMSKCESAQRRSMYAERDRAIRRDGMMTEAEFERDCFLSILASIKRKHVNMLELGARQSRTRRGCRGSRSRRRAIGVLRSREIRLTVSGRGSISRGRRFTVPSCTAPFLRRRARVIFSESNPLTLAMDRRWPRFFIGPSFRISATS